MDIEQLLNFINFDSFLTIGIKLFGIVGAIFYTVFSIVVFRQTQVMKRTVEIKDGGLLLSFASIQCIVGVLLVLYSLFIL
ncbi:MAG TPA: DUF5657 family protein [Patescibacteria group bacterium]|nr:DUF5657 family protein [Patescibacteria group bacterium]